MKRYRIVISDGVNVRGYTSNSRNVLKHAYNLGHADDTVTVLSAAGKVLSQATWDGREYIRVFPGWGNFDIDPDGLDYIDIT